MSRGISITGVILAGGRARRMGGCDKGLLTLAGRPLIEHVLEQLSPQVDRVLINANRNRETYARYGVPVVTDRLGDYPGPLAGMAAAMQACATSHLLTVPCDGPHLPQQLAVRLRAVLLQEHMEIAVAHDGLRVQPVYALLSCRLLPSLLTYLETGGRKIDRWYAEHGMAVADFAEQRDAFANINTPEALADLERVLQAASSDLRTTP